MVFKNLNNLVTKLINAKKSRKKIAVFLKTGISLNFFFLLKKEGVILGFTCFKFKIQNFIKIFLKYINFLPVISKIKIISKPSNRIFFDFNSLLKFNIDIGLMILHTNYGLLSNKQCQFLKIGGEAIIFFR